MADLDAKAEVPSASVAEVRAGLLVLSPPRFVHETD